MATANTAPQLRKWRGTQGILDNQVRVSTPENVSFQYETVGPARRLMAYLLDVGFTLVAFCLVAAATVLLFGFLNNLLRGTTLASTLDLLGQLALMFFLIGAFLSLWFYGAFMEAMYNGQTFGKMLSGIRVISSNGSAIDATQATLRNFFRLLDVSPFLPLSLVLGPDAAGTWIPLFGFGLLSMTISRKYQRLGDLVSGTMVVSESRKWTHGLADFEDPRVAELATALPLDSSLSPSLARALAEYVDGRRFLPYQRANEVAAHIARPLINHFGLPHDTNYDLLVCALYYQSFVQHGNTDRSDFGGTGDVTVENAERQPELAVRAVDRSTDLSPVMGEEVEASE